MSNVSEIKVGDRVRSLVTETPAHPGGSGVVAGGVYEVQSLTDFFHHHQTRPSLTIQDGTRDGHYLYGDQYEPVEEPAVAPHAGTEERLMIEALPKGGFKINRPSTFLHNDADELAAFSTLAEAVAFIGREMRA